MLSAQQSEVLKTLQESILKLQGVRQSKSTTIDIALGLVSNAFPNRTFPTGAVHEFLCNGSEGLAATTGFISALLTSLMNKSGVSIWISSSRTVFPPGLRNFGLEPDKIVFVDVQKERDVMWAMDEALKCESLTAVIGEVKDIDFTASRRLQLAVEQSSVTGFVLRGGSRISTNKSIKLNPTACVSRWQITPSASRSIDGLPGIGYPQWNVDLMKIRNGTPGTWTLAWDKGRFEVVDTTTFERVDHQRKAG